MLTLSISSEYGNKTIEPTLATITTDKSTSSVDANDNADTTTKKEGNPFLLNFKCNQIQSIQT